MPDLILTRTLNGLAPADDFAREAIRHWKVGATLRAQVTKMRNASMHRKFFALLTTVWQACDQYPTVDALLTDLKFRLGHTDDVLLVSTGEVVRIPKSISFAAMDQVEFGDFYERALRELCEMAGGIDSDMLRQTVLEQLAAA
jgi:hypothetical protein